MAKYEERFYRLGCRPEGLVGFSVLVRETDLFILAERDLSAEARQSVMDHRRSLEAYLAERPEFLDSLMPLPGDPMAPALARSMLAAAQKAGTGPMAAVAGAISQAVGKDLARHSPAVLVENGGDLYLDAGRELTIGLHAGKSPFSGRLGLKISPEAMPLGLAASSGTVGHSLSLGKADAAVVAASDAALADACATALGNRVGQKRDMAPALEWVSEIEGVSGALLILGEELAAWGEITLARLEG